jgi:hypothetical protein
VAPIAPSGATRPGAAPLLAAVLLALGCLLATQYGYAPQIPFINDDYVFLDKTRDAAFGSLWLPRELAFHWYRPWSRELHYWTLQRLFGMHEAPFHVVSLALVLAVGASFAWLAYRLAGPVTAAIASAGLMAMAAWAIPAVWIAGVQDVWMLLFCMLCLIALDARRRVLATAACALALLSKETAAMLPAIATVFVAMRGRRRPVDESRATAPVPVSRGRRWVRAVRQTAGLWGVLVVWVAFHPLLGGRLVHPAAIASDPGLHPSLPSVITRTLLALVSLDQVPRPEAGWPTALLRGLPAVVALGGLVAWAAVARGGSRRASEATGSAAKRGSRADSSGARAPSAPGFGVVALGALWAVLGWLPLFVPSIGWHAYYALLGACGAWLALGALLSRRPAFAVALIAALVLVRSGRATTVSRDWGTEFYQTRAAVFLASMRDDLLRLHPTVPPHSRLYFVLIPSEVGFLAGDAPVLRVWYGDPTLKGGRFKQYRARRPGEPGRDFFFRYDGRGWIEIPADSSAVLPPGDAIAAADAGELGSLFAQAGDWPRAAIQYERLARTYPAVPERVLSAGVARAMAGDTAVAVAWLERATGLPNASDSVRTAVREILTELGSRPRADRRSHPGSGAAGTGR